MRAPPIVLSLAGLLTISAIFPPRSSADVPSTMNSYFVPQAGPVGAPLEGDAAIPFFHTCPNNDGPSSLPNNARIRVVVRNAANLPMVGLAAQDIGFLLNGGTPAQGFAGIGADSVISNSQLNPLCPDLRFVTADAPTGLDGTTYITFRGADVSAPGVAVRNPDRKWGHYDSELPIFVMGLKFSGRLTTTSANGSYTLRIKNLDWAGGLEASEPGESVTLADFNGVANWIGVNDPLSYWKDFDSRNGVTATDLNLITSHMNHNCTTPNSP